MMLVYDLGDVFLIGVLVTLIAAGLVIKVVTLWRGR